MNGYLLDVNVLIALFWPSHTHHDIARAWFEKRSKLGWATSALTQTSFVRIVSNPAFSANAVSPANARRLLEENIKHRHHRYWADEVGFVKVTEAFADRLVGHRQVTDAYLLGLALHRRGILATFDAEIRSLIAAKTQADKLIEQLAA